MENLKNLLNEIEVTDNINDKIDLMIEYSKLSLTKDLTKGFAVLEHAYKLALDNSYEKGVCLCLYRFASYEFFKGNRAEAIKMYNISLARMENANLHKEVAACRYSIGTVHAMMGNFSLALDHLLIALELSEKHNLEVYVKTLSNLSNMYFELNQYDDSRRIINILINYLEVNDKDSLHLPFTMLGEMANEENDYNKALRYAEKSLLIIKDSDIKAKAFCNNVMAEAYMGLNHNKEALLCYNRALELFIECNDTQNVSNIYMSIATLYSLDKEFDLAIEKCNLSLEAANKHYSALNIGKSYLALSEIHEKKLDYKLALEYYKKSIEMFDEVKDKSFDEKYNGYVSEFISEKEILDEKYHNLEELEHSEKIKLDNTNLQLDKTLKELEETYNRLVDSEKAIALSDITETFVETFIDILDMRDTTTAGHSKRIAGYCTEMLQALNKNNDVYKDLVFSKEEMKEMYYSSLLHDIGKLGIREEVLLKERRLNTDRHSIINYRLSAIKSVLNSKLSSGKLEDEELVLLEKIDEYKIFISKMVSSSNITEEELDILNEIYNSRIKDYNDTEMLIINDDELEHLSVRRGNLTSNEWIAMKSHATLTREFLEGIPWLESLKNVPTIASGHHEKLDGSGYPKGLKAKDLTIQMRILSMIDIFEALTANDRPYKKTLSIEEALDILKYEVDDGKLDEELLKFFIENRICYIYDNELRTISEMST